MKVAIADIIIPDRFREANPKAVAERAESFRKMGQLQPIILTEDNHLLAGLHRLLAAKSLGWTHIDAVYQGSLTEIQKREIELEENVSRLDMSWFEKAKAIAEIDKLKREQDPHWSRDMTMAVIGSARPNDVTDAIKITKMAELFPELKNAKSLSQAQSWASSKAASVVRLKEVRSNPADFQEIEEKIRLGDSVEIIKSLPTGSFRAVITDPPFGLDYDKRKAGTEQSVSSYEDSKESYERLLSMASDLFRVIKDDGWLTWFHGPTWTERCKLAFRETGFVVDEIPVIWYRRGGRAFTTRPDRYYGRIYDMALHCLKGNPEMTPYGRGKSNVLEIAPIEGEERELLVERPIELYQELIKRLTVEGETVADFFVGSGSCPAAAASLRRNYFGCELDAERRAVAIKKVKANTPDNTTDTPREGL